MFLKFMKSKEFLSEKMKVLPDLKVEFLDFNSILGKHNASIQEMKKYYGPNNKTVWLPPGDLRYLFLSLFVAEYFHFVQFLIDKS